MSRPRTPVPPGATIGHWRVVEQAPDNERGERCFAVEAVCCGGRRVSSYKSLTTNARVSTGRCVSCLGLAPERLERLAAGREKQRALRDARRIRFRASRMKAAKLTPGKATDEIVIWIGEEPCAIESLADFRRALVAGDCADLFGMVRGVFTEEAA